MVNLTYLGFSEGGWTNSLGWLDCALYEVDISIDPISRGMYGNITFP